MSRSARIGAVAAAAVVAVLVAVAVGLSVGFTEDTSPGREASAATGSDVDAEVGTAPGEDPAGSPAGSEPADGDEPAQTDTTPEPDAPVPAERPLLCTISAQQVRGLLGTAGSGPETAEALRTGIVLLDERLQEWRSGAAGLPAVEEDLEIVDTVADGWEQALIAFDTGESEAAQESMDDAERALSTLDAALADTTVPGC